MKKIWILSAIVLASVTGWMLVPAEPACAAPFCTFGGMTSTTWGMGSSCDDARNNARVTLLGWIPVDCDECGTTLIPLGDCDDDSDGDGVYTWDFKMRYRCEQEFIDPPM